MISRLVEWWQRTSWGWLVILAPALCYMGLLVSLDVVGLAADAEPYFRLVDPRTAFRSGIELDLVSMYGRMEYALLAALYLLVASFSILWAMPKIFARWRNPFGGVFGLLLAISMTIGLYWLYLISDYNIRTAFADETLRLAEQAGVLDNIVLRFWPLGLPLYEQSMPQSEMLEQVHAIVYLIGGAAPWVLVVFMACVASFEPRSLGAEPHRALRARMANLQIAVVLAAINIVLSVAYLRAMTAWPVKLYDPELSAFFLSAANRYAAVFGALGSLMLVAALAPAYAALNRQFDRVAEHELMREGDDYVSFQERIAWRAKHGLLLSFQQGVTAGAAVIAPLMTSPTLDASSNDNKPPTFYEQRIDAVR